MRRGLVTLEVSVATTEWPCMEVARTGHPQSGATTTGWSCLKVARTGQAQNEHGHRSPVPNKDRKNNPKKPYATSQTHETTENSQISGNFMETKSLHVGTPYLRLASGGHAHFGFGQSSPPSNKTIQSSPRHFGVTSPRHLHARPISRRHTHFEGDQTPPHPPSPWASRMAQAGCRARQMNCLMRCSGAVSPSPPRPLPPFRPPSPRRTATAAFPAHPASSPLRTPILSSLPPLVYDSPLGSSGVAGQGAGGLSLVNVWSLVDLWSISDLHLV